jgi:hypothetical protein
VVAILITPRGFGNPAFPSTELGTRGFATQPHDWFAFFDLVVGSTMTYLILIDPLRHFHSQKDPVSVGRLKPIGWVE